tara:strand:- start:829 stop:1158 length:330 start_codon:yes stop_codon:yes gene_type:complete
MNLNKTLEKLVAEKEVLLSSIELSCKSIEFWEKKADSVFKKMDDFETEVIFQDSQDSEKKYKILMEESDRLMNRINFENSQLDELEGSILDLEEKIIKALARYAKKQKK